MSKSKIVSYKVVVKTSKHFGQEGVFIRNTGKRIHLKFKDGSIAQFISKNIEKVSK